jgi:hypothetical protein
VAKSQANNKNSLLPKGVTPPPTPSPAQPVGNSEPKAGTQAGRGDESGNPTEHGTGESERNQARGDGGAGGSNDSAKRIPGQGDLEYHGPLKPPEHDETSSEDDAAHDEGSEEETKSPAELHFEMKQRTRQRAKDALEVVGPVRDAFEEQYDAMKQLAGGWGNHPDATELRFLINTANNLRRAVLALEQRAN